MPINKTASEESIEFVSKISNPLAQSSASPKLRSIGKNFFSAMNSLATSPQSASPLVIMFSKNDALNPISEILFLLGLLRFPEFERTANFRPIFFKVLRHSIAPKYGIFPSCKTPY